MEGDTSFSPGIYFRKRFIKRCHANHLGPVKMSRVKDGDIKEKRGLFTTRAVKQGELLLITNSLVSADIEKIFHEFKSYERLGIYKSLQELADQDLLDQLERLASPGSSSSRVVQQIIQCMADGQVRDMDLVSDLSLMNKEPIDFLHVNEEDDRGEEAAKEEKGNIKVDRAHLQAVLKANAHGPEFKQYPQIERDWRMIDESLILADLEQEDDNDDDEEDIIPPSASWDSDSNSKSRNRFRKRLGGRLVGLYPIPALINHSCMANACRVFVGETMLVRATKDIKANEEIVWPYISPLQPYIARQRALEQSFGFCCTCARCRLESQEMPPSYLTLQERVLNRSKAILNKEEASANLSQLVEEVDQVLMESKKDAEAKRWCRASLLNLYFDYFNSINLQSSLSPEDSRRQIVKLQNELFFSLMAANNCSTEHLSLMHVCYESAGYAEGVGSKLSRFWIEQLKRGHITRYGPIQDVQQMTELLKHTRLILRTLDGYRKAKYSFL